MPWPCFFLTAYVGTSIPATPLVFPPNSKNVASLPPSLYPPLWNSLVFPLFHVRFLPSIHLTACSFMPDSGLSLECTDWTFYWHDFLSANHNLRFNLLIWTQTVNLNAETAVTVDTAVRPCVMLWLKPCQQSPAALAQVCAFWLLYESNSVFVSTFILGDNNRYY